MRNPFEYGWEVGLEEIVDRKEELATIHSVNGNGGKLFLIGPRRFGKTLLLSAADEEATKDGVVVICLDAEKYESLELLSAAILTQAARALRGPLERTLLVLAGEGDYGAVGAPALRQGARMAWQYRIARYRW